MICFGNLGGLPNGSYIQILFQNMLIFSFGMKTLELNILMWEGRNEHVYSIFFYIFTPFLNKTFEKMVIDKNNLGFIIAEKIFPHLWQFEKHQLEVSFLIHF